MAVVGIRDYLKNKYGVTDDDITYNNGTVMLKNRPYINATPQADSKTYADPNQLSMADNNYAMQDALQQYKQRISQPIQQFSYDPNSDPAYQSALQQAKQNAQTASNNAMVALGSRGIGNSSITGDRVAQIQQREYGNVVNNVLPQLIQQAYNRYYNGQLLQNQQNGELLNLANTYNNLAQQQFNNNRLTQQDHINLANTLTNTFGVPVMPKEDPGLAYDQVAGLTPLAARVQLGNLDIARQNAASLEAERQAMAKYRDAEAARQYSLANRQLDASNSANSLAKQRYQDELNQREIEAQVMDHAQEFQSPQDVEDYFRANGAYLTKYLGAVATNKLKQSLLSPYTQANKSATSTYEKALSMAQKDPRWLMPNTDKQALIKEYQDLVNQQ